ncbi:MAG: hypothetical protein AMXMBFR48_29920 [Ignavibacteriales bacterium]
MKKNFLFFFVLLLASTAFAQVEVSTRLARALQNSSPTDYIKGFVYLRDQVDIEALDQRLYAENATLERRAYEVITSLQNKAQSTQQNLISYFDERYTQREVFSFKSFWIANMILIEAKSSVFYELMNNMEVAQMDLDAELKLDKPTVVEHQVDGTESVEPGLKIIGADKLWAMGITGQGRLVMGIDTGVDPTHPALNHKWRGNTVPASQAWFDPGGGSTTPNDCDGHGTHTVGTMAGRSTTTADTVGVAPDAQWIAAKTICSSPHTSNSVAAFQWAINPDGNATTITDMPDAIGNSWYDPNITDECTGIYKTTLDAVEAAGIAVVFSAGNGGPGVSTITKPKNLSTTEVNVFSVANIVGSTYLGGSNDPIASSSSRGPSACGGTGSFLIKPEVSAPGTSVRSSYPGGGYSSLTGTSMACPHVVGAIALLKQFAPTLTGHQIKMALYNTAKDLGAVGEDNNYGMGLIDLYAAFLSLGVPDTVAPTQVTNLTAFEPNSNGLKLSWTVPHDTTNGGVTGYNIRMSNAPITDTIAFNNAQSVPFGGAPGASGTTDMVSVGNLQSATTYYFAIRARDMWGNWSLLSNSASGTTLGAPALTVTPDSLNRLMAANSVYVDSLVVSNASAHASTLNYQVSLENNTFPGNIKVMLVPNKSDVNEGKFPVKGDELSQYTPGLSIEGQGGPDAFGYKWIDSDEPNGPVYEWNDIAANGTVVTNWLPTGTFGARDEGHSGPISLPFSFKFYGQAKNTVYVSSNGVILFNAPTANIFTNAAIPTAASPNEYIAPFWDDLDGTSSGEVYYRADGNKFTIQFTNWRKYSASTSSLTFQVVLHANGRIMYYYNNMNATLNSATVGIEDAAGAVGLQTAYNAVYVKNNHAVKYAADPEWLTTQHTGGTLNNGAAASVVLEFRSEDYPAGHYSLDVVFTTNDPLKPTHTVPVKLYIDGEVPVELTSFTGSVNGNTALLEWVTATEVNNKGFRIERRRENSSWNQVSYINGRGNSTEINRYEFTESGLETGVYYYRLVQEDYNGTGKTYDAIEVEISRPDVFSLNQNYPNPFNPSTSISFSLPVRGNVVLDIYSSLGEKVATLVNEIREAGYHQVSFDAGRLTSGTYIYTIRVSAGEKSFTDTKKMTLVK